MGQLGCTDPEQRLQDFSGRVVDANTNTVDAELITSVPDVTGEHLFALSPAPFPGSLFKFRAEATLVDGASDEPKLDIAFYALDARNNVEIGGPFYLTPNPTPVSPTTGEWGGTLNWALPGNTNPVSGTALTVEASYTGVIKTADHMCGTAMGEVVDPFVLSLDGSTFGTVRIPEGGTPNDVEPVPGCLASPDDPDAGVPDAGTPDAGTPDAGTPDAGAPDADTPDADVPDADVPDAL